MPFLYSAGEMVLTILTGRAVTEPTIRCRAMRGLIRLPRPCIHDDLPAPETHFRGAELAIMALFWP